MTKIGRGARWCRRWTCSAPRSAPCTTCSTASPAAKPGLFYASDRERFDRQAAIDYTLKHDDGQRPHELELADVVLVGVSRAAKSTTCFYLAFQGLKAANVPLVFGTPVPPQLAACDRAEGDRPERERVAPADRAPGPRGQPRRSARGLLHEQARGGQRGLHAAQLVKQHGWRTIEASYLAVEEIAREVMRMLGSRG